MMKNDFEDQLDQIRIEIYENMKGKSTKEIVEETNANARKIAEKYGITIVKKDPVRPKKNIAL